MVEIPLPALAGNVVVRLDGSVPVIVLPDDLRFEELKGWIRERLPGAMDTIGARSCRLDIGAREIQLFDLRRLLHLLRDEFGVDATGLYLRSDAVVRYAERELKLKLFPTEPGRPAAEPVDPAAGRPAERTATAEAGAGRSAEGSAADRSAENAAAKPEAARSADPDAVHLPGLADLQALLGGETGAPKAESPAFEPGDAVRRTSQAPAAAEAEPEADGATRTLTLRKTLRSGAAIHFDGDVIVVGDVNAGAQIRAAGNIIVLGKLRGVVHAGAQGDENAFILAFDLAPTQLRIARHIAIAPARATSDDAFRPEIATVADAAIVIEPWRGTRRR